MRASQPALLAAGRVIVESRDAIVAEWTERLGDRLTAARTIPRSLVEREFRLLLDLMAHQAGPPAELPAECFGAREVVALEQGAGGRNERNAASRNEFGWTDRRF